MEPKPTTSQATQAPPPSSLQPDDPGDGEETEIAAQILIPPDGGWGWVVLFGSFTSICLLDGGLFTFGSFITDIQDDFKISASLVALSNSVAIAVYFLASPIASGLINRFGFRPTVMIGSVICSFSLFITYFANGFAYFFVFYSGFNGFGASLINMSAGVIVGFYFEKLRSLALSISTCGTSLGITVFSPLYSYVVKEAGWRTGILLQSGLFGIIFFLGMTFRPLLSLTVTKYEGENENPSRTVTKLPNLAATGGDASKSKSKGLTPKTTERLFQAVSNANFPTAAAVIGGGLVKTAEAGPSTGAVSKLKLTTNGPEDGLVKTAEAGPSTGAGSKLKLTTNGPEDRIVKTAEAGPSTGAVSKLKLTTNGPEGGISRRQLKLVKSLISRHNIQDKTKMNIEIDIPKVSPKKRGCCGRLCHWESEVPESRPMYRDDAFYEGKLEDLPAYQKSMVIDTEKTGIEYQLAVSRAVTVNDIQERHGICTTATRRVLATMIDPTLLKQCSFRMMCISGFLTYMGVLVPYVYLRDRNEKAGVDPKHCNYFVSAIGASNAIGRFLLGYLATKISPFIVYGTATFLAGLTTALSSLSYTIVFQYSYSLCFGCFTSTITSLRSILLVQLCGLEKLTSCTGILCLFLGIGNLLSTPVAGIVQENFGYDAAFFISGTFIALSGIVVLLIKRQPSV